MFPHDSRDHHRKRKFIEVGNTSTDPFGLNANVDATFHGRSPTPLYPKHNVKNMLDRPIKSFTSLLLDGCSEDYGDNDDDDDDYVDDYGEEKDDNLDVFREKCKGQVIPLMDPLMESDHKMNLHMMKNETDGLWSRAIIQEAEKLEEKDAEIQKLSHDLYNKTRQLVACQLENIVLEKKTKMAVKKLKSLGKTMKKVVSRRLLRRKHIHVVSRPGGGQEEDVAESSSSFVVTQRNEEAWLFCKVCATRKANMIICPCKHLSVCTRCDDTITKCPICNAAKISSVEVRLP